MPLTLLAVLCLAAPAYAASSEFSVHEWGTFTSLQDESGRTIAGINSDDEPVPPFVHTLNWSMIIGDAAAQARNFSYQLWPRAHRDVTMRLETPVLYVHADDAGDVKLDVSVEFRGGWLTQFYPDAEVVGPDNPRQVNISSDTRGRLAWQNVTLRHDDPELPKTDWHVWTTPRNVDATTLATPKGEAEKYLFYRGVGHLDSPLRVIRTGQEQQLVVLQDNRPAEAIAGEPMKLRGVWLTDIREDGSAAFRAFGEVTALSPTAKPRAYEAAFAPADYAADNVAKLRASMKTALIADGLFDDEAEAMLETWSQSYFKSWGLRVFFVVPRAWTDAVLPLRVDPPPKEVRRVMVGRIDLVTPRHRDLLAKLAGAKAVKRDDPALWKIYEQLGRFRNALVLEELRRRPSESLGQFIRLHGLEGHGRAE